MYFPSHGLTTDACTGISSINGYLENGGTFTRKINRTQDALLRNSGLAVSAIVGGTLQVEQNIGYAYDPAGRLGSIINHWGQSSHLTFQ